MNKQFNKFLSSGFGALNRDNSRHIIDLYRYNYSKFLPVDKEAQILEIGCGMGRFLEFLGQAGYQNFLGVDISREATDYCMERGISKVKLIEDLGFFLSASGMYDLIVMNDVIEHLPKEKILSILEKINQKLNHGGVLIVKTGNLASLVGPRIRYNDFTHEVGFTEYSLCQALLLADFTDIMNYSYKFPLNRPRRVLRWLGQKLIHGIWKMVYFFEYTDVPKIVDELIFAVAKK